MIKKYRRNDFKRLIKENYENIYTASIDVLSLLQSYESVRKYAIEFEKKNSCLVFLYLVSFFSESSLICGLLVIK